jgi:hypothetical protein
MCNVMNRTPGVRLLYSAAVLIAQLYIYICHNLKMYMNFMKTTMKVENIWYILYVVFVEDININ